MRLVLACSAHLGSDAKPRSVRMLIENTRSILADCRRVHPPVSHPRPAQGLPPHPPLRPVCQRQSPKTIETAHKLLNLAQPAAEQTSETRSDAATRAAMPLLRRPHVRHRNLRGRLPATSPASRASRRNHDRHLMIANTISRIIARFPRWYWVELPFPGSTDYIGPPQRPYHDEDEAT